ncbi:hypothetical protein LSAT2_020355 [Lamellibrachia satsuma]|nr:hypothetical protein LSAT2_020355 [Lamellibrachia satsuma]
MPRNSTSLNAMLKSRSCPRDVFKIIDRLMHRSTPNILPSHDTFAEIFTHKITKIRSDLSLARDHQQHIPQQASPDEDEITSS